MSYVWREWPGVGMIWVRAATPRELRFIDQYKAGWTLQEIATAENLTRERVRQLLSRHGITGRDGGIAARWPTVLTRVIERRDRLDATAFRKWGLTRAEYEAIVSEYGASAVKTSPLHKFSSQRKNAKQRGIGWEMTFKEWWRIWRDSGRWEQRGKGRGYCMARKGDSGPYSPGNVYICTCAENFSDSYLVDHPRRKASKKLLASDAPLRWAA